MPVSENNGLGCPRRRKQPFRRCERPCTLTPLSWRCDAIGRLIEERRQAPSAANDYLDRFTYDLVGNRLRHQRTATAGVTDTRYSYNAMDQLLTQSVGAAATGFGYDAFGRMTSRTPSGGPALSYSYTADDRLAAVAKTMNKVPDTLSVPIVQNGQRGP